MSRPRSGGRRWPGQGLVRQGFGVERLGEECFSELGAWPHLNVSSRASRCPAPRPRSTATLSTTPNSWLLASTSREAPGAGPSPPASWPGVLRTACTSSWVLRTTTRSGRAAAEGPPPAPPFCGSGRVSHAAAQCVTAVGGCTCRGSGLPRISGGESGQICCCEAQGVQGVRRRQAGGRQCKDGLPVCTTPLAASSYTRGFV